MKLITILLMLLSPMLANAFWADENGNEIVPPEMRDRCFAKGDVAVFAYRYRDKMTEDRMLEYLDYNWSNTWSKVEGMHYSTYVDMQRIIRDAYRKNRKGEYKKDCCTEDIEAVEAIDVMNECLSSNY